MTPEERKWADWCLDNHQSFSSNTQEALTHFVAEERERCMKAFTDYVWDSEKLPEGMTWPQLSTVLKKFYAEWEEDA